jgi:hypothetical protein
MNAADAQVTEAAFVGILQRQLNEACAEGPVANAGGSYTSISRATRVSGCLGCTRVLVATAVNVEGHCESGYT